MNNNELRHWGVKGMRWGVRRYQTKDGTLTPAGKKRYAKEMEKLKAEQKVLSNKKRTQAKIDKLTSLRKSIDDQKREIDSGVKTNSKDSKSNKRTLKDLSDAELRDKVNRLELERRYKDLAKNEEQVDQGKTFAKKYAGEAAKKIILDNAVDIISQAVKHYMATGANNKIGVKDEKGKIKEVVFANNKKKS